MEKILRTKEIELEQELNKHKGKESEEIEQAKKVLANTKLVRNSLIEGMHYCQQVLKLTEELAATDKEMSTALDLR